MTDAELLAMYPSKPYKLVLAWNDARAAVARTGEAFVAAGRIQGSPEDRALCEATRAEQIAADRIFSPTFYEAQQRRPTAWPYVASCACHAQEQAA